MRFSVIETAARTIVEKFLFVCRTKIVLLAAFVLACLGLVLGLKTLSPKHGLTGRYFANGLWSGPPATTALDPVLHFEKSAAAERTGFSESSSVEWEGFAYAPKSSAYRFTVTSDGGAWVYLDGVLLIDNGGVHPARMAEKEIELSRGNHRLLIKYLDTGGPGPFDFRWRETKTSKALMPRLYLYPKPAGLGPFVFDTALRYFLPALQALLCAAGLLLLITSIRAVLPRWELAAVLALGLFLVIAGAYEIDIFLKRSGSVTGCDSYAYLQGALLMARDGFFHTEYRDPLIPQVLGSYATKPAERQTIFLLSPHGHYVHDLERGIVYNVFPPGMFILLYPFVGLFGRSAAFLVLPLLGLALLAAFFLWGTKKAGPVFSMALCAAVFFNEQVFGNTVRIMSDVPSLALIAASAFLLYRNIGTPRRLYPILGGIAFGFAVMVRYSNVAGLFPLAYLLWRRYREDGQPKALAKDVFAFSAAAVLFGLLPLAFYTMRLFGTAFRLVYEPYNQSRMQWANLGPGISFYAKTLVQTFGPFGLALMAFGLAVCLARRSTRPAGLACSFGFLSFFIFYVLNSIQQERYLLPAFPFLAVLSAFGVQALAKAVNRSFLLKFLIIAACVSYPFLYSKDRYFVGSFKDEEVSLKLQKTVEAKSVVFCDDLSGPLRLYAGLPAYRLAWTDGPTLEATLSYFVEQGFSIYFLLDTWMAADFFEDMIRQGAISQETVRLVSKPYGFPLYRFTGKSAPAQPVK